MSKPEPTPPIDKDALRASLVATPYLQALGLEVDTIADDEIRLVLPFAERNSNPGGVLHGGVAASLLAIGSRSVARAHLAADSGPWVLGQLQVNYLSAAREETVVATARLQRRGRALCFVETQVTTEDGQAIAAATAVVRAEGGVAPENLPKTFGDAGGTDPGPLAAHLEKAPFMAGRGMQIVHMAEGRSRVTMPCSEANQAEDGRIHDGAILALLDTAGAMAAWAEAGPARWKASTASLQAQTLAPPPAGEVVAYARCTYRDQEMYWSDVEIADPNTQQVLTRGTVFYRLAP